MIVLDTDIMTLVWHGKNKALQRHIESIEGPEQRAVALITRMEILAGRFASLLKAANESELRTAMERFRSSLRWLDTFLTLEVNDHAIQHFERLRQQKRLKMRRPDMLIACIALAHEALLVTRNIVDYQRVVGLRVENWAD